MPNIEPIPFEYWRWKLAELYGWTLDYIDTLDLETLEQWFQIQDGIGKSREWESTKKKRKR